MKFNLKNRPKTKKGGSMPYLPLGSEWEKRFSETEKWFEGFEKELREALKRNPPMAAVEVIKEILGETP